MKTFDLSKKYDFTTNLQQNLKILYKMFGSKFNIRWGKLIVPAKFTKTINKLNKHSFYSLIYDIVDKTQDLYPFKIDFYDVTLKKLNNNSYISNIHRFQNISGTDMVQLVLQINRVLKVEKSWIYDGTRVSCFDKEYDLSYVKLLQTNNTFYMNNGFEINVSPDDWFLVYFPDKETKKKYIIETIKACRKVKNSDVLKAYTKLLDALTYLIKNQDYSELKIYSRYIESVVTNNSNYWLRPNADLSIMELLSETKTMIDILSNAEDKYLYETIVNLFNDQKLCPLLDPINKHIIDNLVFKISYGKYHINFEFLDCFKLLKQLRYSYYSYTY